jgi:pSer/pThr/pTyr-binding forkhead associated (FHA) protein
MPVITVNDQQYALHPGPNRLGAGAEADVRVGVDDAHGVRAIVDVASVGHPVIRPATTDAAVRVNGVPLVDPTPLMHGDKVEIGGIELLYSEDAKSGATQVIAARDVAAIASRPADSTGVSGTGGRLVSLFDGKDYPVPADGMSIGRDAACTVVVAQNEVSRRHAIIMPVGGGYEIRDLSANGILVNNVRVDGTQYLGSSDVIQIGSEEFRFHAAAQLAVTRHTPVAREASAPPLDPARDQRRPLAILQVTNVGPTNGKEYEIRVPLAHIGRGAHNDVAINDESVSDSHAKLQCRDGIWFITDLESTNGTYTAGERLVGERRLDGAADLRFGGIKMTFHPADVVTESARGTRAIAAIDRSKLRLTTDVATQAATTAPSTLPQQGISAWVWSVVVLAIAAAAAFFLVNR